MSWVPVLLALAAGLATGGRLLGLKRIPLSGLALMAAGYILQTATTSLAGTEHVLLFHAGLVGGVVLIAAALLLMLRLPWAWLALLGLLSNLAAMLANGGAMAITPDLTSAAGFATRPVAGQAWVIGGKSIVRAWNQTRLGWLTDVIPIHAGGYFKVFSAGDLLFAIGLGLMVYALLKTPAAQPVRASEEERPYAAASSG